MYQFTNTHNQLHTIVFNKNKNHFCFSEKNVENSDKSLTEVATGNQQILSSVIPSPVKDMDNSTSRDLSDNIATIQQQGCIDILPSLGDEYDDDRNLVPLENNFIVFSFDSPQPYNSIRLTENATSHTENEQESTNLEKSIPIEKIAKKNKNISIGNPKYLDMPLLDEDQSSQPEDNVEHFEAENERDDEIISFDNGNVVVNAEVCDSQILTRETIDLSKVVYIGSISDANLINLNPGSLISVQILDVDDNGCAIVRDADPVLSQAQCKDSSVENWETSETILTETENELLQQDLQNDLCWQTIIDEIQDDSMPMFLNDGEEAKMLQEQSLQNEIKNNKFPIVYAERCDQLIIEMKKQKKRKQQKRRYEATKERRKPRCPKKKLVDKCTETDVEFNQQHKKNAKQKRNKKSRPKDTDKMSESDLPRINLKIKFPISRKDLSRCMDNLENVETQETQSEEVSI